jgi:hypothetical protein
MKLYSDDEEEDEEEEEMTEADRQFVVDDELDEDASGERKLKKRSEKRSDDWRLKGRKRALRVTETMMKTWAIVKNKTIYRIWRKMIWI